MEEKDLLSRIEKLEKRVALLETELTVIAQINQSEKVKEYITSVEKSKKIARLLDIGSKKSGELEFKVERAIDESIANTLRDISSVNGLETAKKYVSSAEVNINNEIDEQKELIKKYDWDALFEYSINGKNIKIDRYIGFDDMETIIIPEEINGHIVTEIGNSVFKNCKSIKEIILPDTIECIGFEAFANSGLEKINLQEGIKSIGARAFSGTQIVEISIPASLEGIAHSTFSSCNLERIYFQEGIVFIDEHAFSFCRQLKKIDIPNSVKKIGLEAFSNIISTTIRYGVGEVAINNLDIRIPDSVDDIFGMNKTNSRSHDNIFGFMKNKGICIYCNPGSTAMKFAREYSIPVKRYEDFVLLEE